MPLLLNSLASIPKNLAGSGSDAARRQGHYEGAVRVCAKTGTRLLHTVDPRFRGDDVVGFTRSATTPSFPRKRESNEF